MNAIRLAITLAVLTAPAVAAVDYFPLNPGNQWSYTMSNGMQMTTAVTGVAQVRGVRCAVVETTMGWQKSREYMAMDAEGLKTYKTEAQGQEYVYDPPVIRIKLPVQTGQTWTSTMQQLGMTITTTNQNQGIERVQTPVGVFDCLKIRSSVSLPGQPPMVSLSYYAPGIGLVHQVIQTGAQQLVAALAATNVKPAPEEEPAAQPTPTPPTAPAQPQGQTGPVQPQATPPTQPTIAVEPKQPAQPTEQLHCPKCNAVVSKDAKFCSECGARIVRVKPLTHCPKCNAKLPAGAKFCPACGAKLPTTAGAPQTPAPTVTPATGPPPNLERYQSPDGTVRLYKPQGWEVQQETFGPGSMAISVMDPEENAAVIFMTFPVDLDINDSVKLMARCMAGLREEYPDIAATRVTSSRERDRTIAEVTMTADGKKGIGHGYFFYTQRIGTVYFLLAREDMWENLRPMLTQVAANVAYAPEGIETIVRQSQMQAAETPVVAGGGNVSPAVMLQQAAQRPGKQVTLRPASLIDQSLTLQIPEGWSLQGQKLQFTTFDDPQNKTHGMGSGSHTIIPSQMQLPGTINAPYQAPPQALALVLELGQIGTNLEILGECPAEQGVPEAAQVIQQMRAQGLQVDARLLHVRFQSIATGATLRGLFTVQCTVLPMSPVWQVVADGSWAPDAEYDEWLPTYLRMAKTAQVDQQWFQGEMQDRRVRQQQLNRNLQSSIAASNQAFEGYMDSLQAADRSRDYISHMWSQTTLGQGTWVAEHEGAKVYQTDSWGIEGPEGRIDATAYNNTNFTGENPWGGEDLDLVDTQAEYEKYIANQ